MKIFITIILLGALNSCRMTNHQLNYRNSKTVAYNLLRVCVDTILHKSPEMNTPNYVVNLSGINSLDSAGKDAFIRDTERQMPLTAEDSIILSNTDDDMQVKKSMVIGIKSIEEKGDNGVEVKISKFIASYRHIEMDIFLKRQGSGYRIYSCLVLSVFHQP